VCHIFPVSDFKDLTGRFKKQKKRKNQFVNDTQNIKTIPHILVSSRENRKEDPLKKEKKEIRDY